MSDRRGATSRAESFGRSAYSILFRNRGHARNRSQTEGIAELEGDEWEKVQRSIEKIVVSGTSDEPIDALTAYVTQMIQAKSATVLVQGLKATLTQIMRGILVELSGMETHLVASRTKDLWRVYNSVSIPYIQGIFVNLQPHQVQKELFFVSTHHLGLSAFRDNIVLSDVVSPHITLGLSPTNSDPDIIQMVGTLSHISSKDANQVQFKDLFHEPLRLCLTNRKLKELSSNPYPEVCFLISKSELPKIIEKCRSNNPDVLFYMNVGVVYN